MTAPCVAQTPDVARLTVRPRDLTPPTRNEWAGQFALDSLPVKYLVTIPVQCWEKRCPLLVFLPGAGYGAEEVTLWVGPAMQKHGIILLAPSGATFLEDPGKSHLDAALKQVLRKFAVDPDKIAIIGRCATGTEGIRLGVHNLDVFSRVGAISGQNDIASVSASGLDLYKKKVEFFIDAGFPESQEGFELARHLRSRGHAVTLAIDFRGHEHQEENYDFLAHWLQQSWAIPDRASRPVPAVVADPLPLLTPEVVKRMTAFWQSFMQEPDFVRIVGRRAHLREVVMPVGLEQPTVWMTDMAALAAHYPSVAADLQKAGLTAQQHDAYRVALFGAMATDQLPKDASTLDSTSTLGKNLAFFRNHPDDFAPRQPLWETHMWFTP